jgi:hypothetical protein
MNWLFFFSLLSYSPWAKMGERDSCLLTYLDGCMLSEEMSSPGEGMGLLKDTGSRAT